MKEIGLFVLVTLAIVLLGCVAPPPSTGPSCLGNTTIVRVGGNITKGEYTVKLVNIVIPTPTSPSGEAVLEIYEGKLKKADATIAEGETYTWKTLKVKACRIVPSLDPASRWAELSVTS
jgi:hypothetical protein